ncbi:MAG: Ig-like domain-containing protein, partial [Patescibacteria group bacterium]
MASITGSRSFGVRVISGMASTTRYYTVNIMPSGGGSAPGISNVSPPGGAQGASTFTFTINGVNTHFSETSAVQILLPPGVPGVSRVTAGAGTAVSALQITTPLAVAADAPMGPRDVVVTSGSEVVVLPGAFTVFGGGSSGLTQLLPTDSATGVMMPPSFSFNQSSASGILSYRVRVTASSNPSAPALWDYAFPKTVDGTGHCMASQCNLMFGAGMYRVITPPTFLSPNTTYYWQIRSYTVLPSAITDSVPFTESTSFRPFTTVESMTDVMPPSIMHRPVFQVTASVAATLFARVFDNLATASSTPPLVTHLIYCAGATDCTPLTSVTGTAIGAGYYSYTIPEGAVGAAGATIRYFLRATDGTNTNNMYQMGGTTPFSITTRVAGAGHISGTVKDQSGECAVVVQNAVVFIDGASAAATTDASCAFTLSNLPSGANDLVVAKTGFGDRRVDGIPTGTENLNIQLFAGTGGEGGFGGDMTRPRVRFQSPPPDSSGIPGGDTNFKVFVVFGKAMSESTITATNLVVSEVTPAGTLTDITNHGTWTYYSSAPPGGLGLPPDANLAAWSFTEGQTFGDRKTIAVAIGPGVTDTSGNPIQGNTPDGKFVWSFSTGQSYTSGGGFGGGSFGSGEFIPPHADGVTPPPGMIGAPMNTRVMVHFTAPMADDSASPAYALSTYLKIYQLSGATETPVSGALSLDTSKQNATFVPGSSLTSGARYRVKVLGGAKAASGLTLAAPDQLSSVVFTSEFQVGTTSDSSAPTSTGSFPNNNATNVPVNTNAISIAFNRDLAVSTITTESVALSIGETSVGATVEYRPMERQVVVHPQSALSPLTTYTVTLSTAITSMSGTPLASAITRSFTTGAADSMAPRLAFCNADDHAVAVTFSEPMNAANAVDTLNWPRSVANILSLENLKYSATPGFDPTDAGTAVVTSDARLSYDSMTNTVVIEGLDLSSAVGNELYLGMQTSGDNRVKDLSGNLLSDVAADSSCRVTVRSGTTTGGQLGPQTTFGGTTANQFRPEGFSGTTFGFAPPIEVRPFNTMAGQTTIYGVRLPLSTQIPNSGKIVLTFPVGFDVSGAKQDVNSPMRADLNGPGTGTPTFACNLNGTGGRSCAGGATVTGDASIGADDLTRGGL